MSQPGVSQPVSEGGRLVHRRLLDRRWLNIIEQQRKNGDKRGGVVPDAWLLNWQAALASLQQLVGNRAVQRLLVQRSDQGFASHT